MNLDSIRWRLTAGYIGIFAFLLLLLGVFAVFGFSRELTLQQDELLAQEARNTTKNLLEGNDSDVLATGSDEFGWIALETDGEIMDRNWTTTSVGLPAKDLFKETLREEEIVAATVQGTNGSARVVSVPMYESGEMVGVMQYARSLRRVQETVNELTLVLLPLVLGALGLAAVGGLYMARRAVRPVREAFERQRSFIADASHELKTPLTLIKADAEVVLYRGDVNPEDRKLIEHALAETDRMSAVLSDLLLIARIDAGKLAVRQEPFDLAGVISETADRFVARAASEGVQLEAQTPGKLRVRGDSERAAQILSILLDNALRHTPSGGSVSVVGSAREGFVEAVVEDSGPGISPEHLPHVFERFYRVDTARSRSSGGTGLGLAIARDLARAQNGDLEAENAEGGGAVFRLKLPVE